jgi:hypothetical protein
VSYDIDLRYLPGNKCQTCGHQQEEEEVFIRNSSPTYNIAPMIRRADAIAGGSGCSFEAIDGKAGADAARWFELMLATFSANADELRTLEPENGWGSFAGMVEVFEEYIRLSKEHPRAVWSQCGASRDGGLCCAGWASRKDDEVRP